MKRHENLQPLSREHHFGLSISQKARTLADDSSVDEQHHHWQQLIDFIQDNQLKHFSTEEKYLVTPLLRKIQRNENQPLSNHLSEQNADVKKLAGKLLAEHELLKTLSETTNPTLDDVRRLGEALYQHIRFEEREVFGLAETLLSKEELEQVFQASLN